MTLGHIALAVVLSGFVASFTDWFFGGFLFHKQYQELDPSLAWPNLHKILYRNQTYQTKDHTAFHHQKEIVDSYLFS